MAMALVLVPFAMVFSFAEKKWQLLAPVTQPLRRHYIFLNMYYGSHVYPQRTDEGQQNNARTGY
jgi:hypothetical protein